MTSTTDRLDRLEQALPPLEAVLVWLSEAHAHPCLTAYVRSTIDLSPERVAIVRILDRVEAYERGRGHDVRDVELAVHRASWDALFRFELVLAIEAAAASFADRFDAVMLLAIERLCDDDPAATTPRPARGRRPCPSDHRWSGMARATAERFRQERDARSSLEARYLGGRSAIFPDTTEAWQRLEQHADILETLLGHGPVGGTDVPELPDDDPVAPDPMTARADEISDEALIATHQIFGEHDAAAVVLRRRLQA